MSRFSSRYLVALLFLAAPASAGERLLVAGSDGAVYQTDPSVNAFEYFACACLGPVNALAADRTNLYVADEFGQLLTVDLHSGAPKWLVAPGLGEISALTATTSGLFVGTPSGQVARVDPMTGEVLDQRTAPAGVRALASLNGNLFVAAADSGIYSAPLAAGELTYFSCFCFFDLQELLVDGDQLLAGDGSGLVIRIDGASGMLLSAQWTLPMNTMALSAGDFLVHGSNGVIGRVDAESGLVLDKLESPADVRAMLVVPDRNALPNRPPAPKLRPRQ